jgi:hypothetical protein
MSIALMLKNSWRKLKESYRILLILFLYIFISFSVIFGVFGMSSHLNKTINVDAVKAGIRIDGDIDHEYDFFTDGTKESENGLTYSIGYRDMLLEEMNNVINDENKKLDFDKDKNFLQALDLNDGNLKSLALQIKQGSVNVGDKSYEDQIKALEDFSTDYWFNIYDKIFSDKLLENKNIRIQKSFLSLIDDNSQDAKFANDLASFISEDFSSKEFRITKLETPTTKTNDLNIYMFGRDFEKYNGKKIAITISTGDVVQGTVVGKIKNDYSKMLRWKPNNFVVDINNLKNIVLDGDKSQNLTTVVEDANYDSGSRHVERINEILKSLSSTNDDETKVQPYVIGQKKLSDTKNAQDAYTLISVLTIMIIVILIVLTVSIMFFIMKELINSDRKILYFLKTMGVKRWRLALLSAMDIFYPILLALICSVPVTFVIQHFMFDSISVSYNITIDMFSTTIGMIIMMSISFVFTIVMFFFLVFLNISPKVLNVSEVNSIPKSQIRLNRYKPAFKKMFNIKNNVIVSFIIKNFYQNLVTLFVFALSIGVYSFGSLFSSTAKTSVRESREYFKPYTNKSTYNSNFKIVYGESNEASDSYIYSNDEMWRGTDENELHDRRIMFVNDVIPHFTYLDERGSKQTISNPDDFKNVDLSGRYITKEDVNSILQSDILSNFESLKDLFTSIANKQSEIKTYYNNYDGTDISFQTNYKLDSDALTLSHLNPTVIDKDNESLMNINLLPVENDVIKDHKRLKKLKTEDSGTYTVTIKSDSKGTVLDKIIPSKTKLKAYNFMLYNEYMKQSKNGTKKLDKLVVDVPQLNVVAPLNKKSLAKEMTNWMLPLMTNEDETKIVYLPLKVKYVNFEGINPASDYFVNEKQFKKIVATELIKVRAGYNEFIKNETLNDGFEIFKDQLKSYSTQKMFVKNLFFGNDTPRAFRELVLSPNGDPNKIESYNLNQDMLTNYPIGFDDYALLSQAEEGVVNPIVGIVSLISYFSLIVAILVSILLIYLILKENQKIIIILKIMGYTKRKVSAYLITGYVISTVLAMFLALGISLAMWFIGTAYIASVYFFNFVFAVSPTFVLTFIIAPILFVMVVWGSIMVESKNSNVNSIELAS